MAEASCAPGKVTEILADFATSFPSGMIPDNVRQHTLACFVNWAACAVAGGQHETLDRAVQALEPFFGVGRASVLGRRYKVDAVTAAFLNGMSSHLLDIDDTHHQTLVHPSSPVVAAVLALAEYVPLAGSDFIDAIAIGIETECRVALGIFPSHYEAGWHITGTVGVLGAAAAACRALRLTPLQTAWALSMAATQSAGVRGVFGSMAKALHTGRAAQHGLESALLARSGFTATTDGIESPRGFARVSSREVSFPAMIEGLGQSWSMLGNAFKPYACGLVLHPVIDACLDARKRPAGAAQHIESVKLQVHPLVLELTGKKNPATGLESKFSVYHAASVALLDGHVSIHHFADAAVSRTDVAAMSGRIGIQTRPDFSKDTAIVTVEGRNGERLESRVDSALGSLDQPMSREQLDDKFLDLCTPFLAPDAARRALAACWSVGADKSVGDVTRHFA